MIQNVRITFGTSFWRILSAKDCGRVRAAMMWVTLVSRVENPGFAAH